MGKVWLVGAGPGAPDLLTLRAARVLEEAEIVLHDALVHPATLALARSARLVDVGKREGRASTDQRFIDRALVEAARSHARVVRLKGGDPMLFGRAQEEIEALDAAGIDYEVVPGITAALAAAASMRTSLTRRGLARSVAFLTPRAGRGEAPPDWIAPAMAADSVMLYMAAGAAREIATSLIAAGKPASTPAVWMEDVSLPGESRVATTLGALAAEPPARSGGPVLMAVGEAFRARAPRGGTLHPDSTVPASASPAFRDAVARIGARYFHDCPLEVSADGVVSARYFRSRITSAFQAMVEATGDAVAGHQATLRVESRNGDRVAPWSLYAHSVDEDALVRLDRLCRTVHALNYFPNADEDWRLFLNEDARLMEGASDQGAYFEAVLALLGVKPDRIVVVLPPGSIDNPVAFVRAAVAYRARGYRVLAPIRSLSEADLSHVFLAAPHYVSIESPATLDDRRWQPLLESLAAQGIEAIARRIESAPQAEAARRAGARLLQGFHLGRP